MAKCSNENCLKNGSNRCSKCKVVCYCSKECQKSHWKLHKVDCTTLSQQSKHCPQNTSTNDLPSYSFAHDQMSQMMTMMFGKNLQVSQEYKKNYPHDFEHIQCIQKEEMIYKYVGCMKDDEKVPIFNDEDFSIENFEKRWGTVLSWEEDTLKQFLSRKDLKPGDIYKKRLHPQYPGTFYQTMRNTAMANLNYEFGNTYIGFGYVDLFQLIWGCYKNEETEILTFYGYDMSRVTNLRSKIIYHMLKLNDATYSTNSILQVWFSSCWDSATLESFKKCVNYLVKHYMENNICKEDIKILKTWQKTKVTLDAAKMRFSVVVRNVMFDDIWKMKKVKDQVKFARYLFTGCVFVSEADIVCGNTTMFPTINGAVKVAEELFFKAIDLSAINFRGKEASSDSLFELIESITTQKTIKFRSLIKSGNIICHLKTKYVDPKDLAFASYIQSLEPYVIDWSNIPDYVEKNAFIKFAAACSVKETLHQLHFINWSNYIFGIVHVDWTNDRDKLAQMYINFRTQLRKDKANNSDGVTSNYPLSFFVDNEVFNNPMNGSCIMLSSTYRNRFEDFFLSDKNGKPLNRLHCNVVDALKSSFFDQCPYMFHAFFTFNYKMNVQSRVRK